MTKSKAELKITLLNAKIRAGVRRKLASEGFNSPTAEVSDLSKTIARLRGIKIPDTVSERMALIRGYMDNEFGAELEPIKPLAGYDKKLRKIAEICELSR